MSDIASPSDVVDEIDQLEAYTSVNQIINPEGLQRAVNVSVETNILEPVSHQYTSELGGVTRWVLPAKGVINMPAVALCFEIVNGAVAGAGTDLGLAFPLGSGGIAMLQRVTVRCGGQIISRVDETALFNSVKTLFTSQHVNDGAASSTSGSEEIVLESGATKDTVYVQSILELDPNADSGGDGLLTAADGLTITLCVEY